MERYLNLLLGMPLFQGITDKKDLAWVLKCIDGEVKQYRAGDTIFQAGEDVYFAGMVLSGIVSMEQTAKTQQTDQMAFVDVGKLIPIACDGEKSVKAGSAVIAKTDCLVLFMRWIRLMKLCNFECAFHKRLIENTERLMQQ